jgi:hypothetical protein
MHAQESLVLNPSPRLCRRAAAPEPTICKYDTAMSDTQRRSNSSNNGSPCNHWARCQVVRRGRQRRMRVLRRNLKLCCHGRREICLYIFARAWSCQLCPSWEQRIRAVCVCGQSPGSQRERETPKFRQWTHSASSRHLAALASSPKLHSSSYAHLRQSCAQRSFVASNLSVLSGTHQHKGSARSALQKWSAATLRLLLLTQMEPNKKWPAVPPGTCGGHQYLSCSLSGATRRTSPSAEGFSASSASCSFSSSTQATAKR